MLSRPVGETRHSGNPKLLLAFAVFLFPWLRLVNADAAANVRHAEKASLERAEQHDEWTVTSLDAIRDAQETLESSDREQHPPNHESSYQKRLQHAKARVQARALDTEHDEERVAKLRNKQNTKKPDDASALATFAPAPAVRAPHSSGHKRSSGTHASGLASPQIARSLGDWEVEDFVLLATVDGNLFASDRNTGKEIWRLQVDQPMVETKHYRANISTLDDDYDAVDHYIWAVEPNRDGSLYVWIPDSAMGLVRTGYTMKHLVEQLSPYAGEQPAVVYTGDKKTTMITLDAATGQVLKWFGSGGSHSDEAESCLRPNGLHGAGTEECSSTGTITLGRVEYTVAIHRRHDLKPIATLKYFEWVPNNFDNDLFQQYHESRDDRYISSKHDGKVYAFDFRRSKHGTKLYSEKFSSPVARVFDVCRPWDAPLESNPPLVILPQPPMPTQEQNEEMSRARDNRIFLNHTEDGGWFALSGHAYPLVVDAPVAQIAKVDWSELGPVWDTISEAQVSRVLVGTHYLDNFQSPAPGHPLTLPPGINPEIRDDTDKENDSLRRLDPPTADINATLIDKVKSLPQSAANSVVDFISNPILIILFFGALIYNEKKLRQGYGQFRRRKSWRDFASQLLNDGDKYRKDKDSSQEQRTVPSVHEQVSDSVEEGQNSQLSTEHNEFENESSKEDSADSPPQELAEAGSSASLGAIPDSESKIATSSAGTEKKKKAHRGRRGGVKHKKGKGRENSLSRNDEPNSATVEEAVNNAKKLGDRPAFEPDVMTVANDMQAVTGPIIRMGNIEVDTEDQLGTGSNGTLVFAGKFDGREVAVKRMLIQFYDIASQETRLLRESDDHPNGTFASFHAETLTNLAASDSLLLSTNSRWVPVHRSREMCSLTR